MVLASCVVKVIFIQFFISVSNKFGDDDKSFCTLNGKFNEGYCVRAKLVGSVN